MINWKVRIKNKTFWLALVPAILILVQVVLDVFNVDFNIDIINEKLISVVNAVFVLLSILGIVNDPTTASIRDSKQALTYDKPKESE